MSRKEDKPYDEWLKETAAASLEHLDELITRMKEEKLSYLRIGKPFDMEIDFRAPMMPGIVDIKK